MSSKFKKQTVLLVPDIHAAPGHSLTRLHLMHHWLTKERKLERLDKVVLIGDVFDFASLCLHDKENPEWYQRSLGEDIDAGMEALDIIMDTARALDCGNHVHFIEGNHEDRYNKWMKSDNRLLTSDFPKTVRALLGNRRPTYPIKYHGFLKPAIINGTAFQHYHVSGVMNRPHAGERPALSMLRQHHMSVVQGHKHTLDFAEHTRPDGTKLYGFVCGCFVDPEAEFGYAGAAQKLWWNGFHLLHFYAPGQFDVESVSLERLC